MSWFNSLTYLQLLEAIIKMKISKILVNMKNTLIFACDY